MDDSTIFGSRYKDQDLISMYEKIDADNKDTINNCVSATSITIQKSMIWFFTISSILGVILARTYGYLLDKDFSAYFLWALFSNCFASYYATKKIREIFKTSSNMDRSFLRFKKIAGIKRDIIKIQKLRAKNKKRTDKLSSEEKEEIRQDVIKSIQNELGEVDCESLFSKMIIMDPLDFAIDEIIVRINNLNDCETTS